MDHQLRLARRQYEQAPSLETAERLINAYQRTLGAGAAEPDGFFVQMPVSEKRIRYLLTTAIEGGSNYWAMIWRYDLAPGYTREDFREGGRMQDPNEYWHPAEIIPFIPGCAVIFVDSNEVSSHADALPPGVEEWRLDLDSLKGGLQIMAARYPRHFANFMESNEDAETGDVFLQCCLFGETVYG